MRRFVVLAVSVAVVLGGVGAVSPVRPTQAATRGRWVITDLGTLGGKGSQATAINDQGLIVGKAQTKAGRSHAFLWENGKMRDLGTLGGRGFNDFDPSAINDRGQVVGFAYKTGSRKAHAFLWQNGRMRDLGTLGGSNRWARDINELGQVVGESQTKAKDAYGEQISHAFLWENGKMRDLGTLGGTHSWAVAINGRGQIVGQALKAGESLGESHVFLWQSGKMRDLGGTFDPKAINEPGRIVGYAQTKQWASPGKDDTDECGDGKYQHHAWRSIAWTSGRIRNLGTLGGPESEATDINDRGQVVGWADTTETMGAYSCQIFHAFVWENGHMTDLGGRLGSWRKAVAINERGQVVGYAETESGQRRALLWTYKP